MCHSTTYSIIKIVLAFTTQVKYKNYAKYSCSIHISGERGIYLHFTIDRSSRFKYSGFPPGMMCYAEFRKMALSQIIRKHN